MCPDVLAHCMVRWASTVLRLCGFSHSYFDAQARRCRHVNESIQTKQIDLPTHEVGDARLRDAEQLSDLGLAKVVRARCAFRAIIRAERSFIFSASSGVPSMASHTLANRFLLMALAPSSSHSSASQPDLTPSCSSSASSS